MDLKVTKEETLKVSAKVETTKEKATVVQFNSIEKVPSSWTILASKDGITAVNNSTRRTFEGTISSFNELLRG